MRKFARKVIVIIGVLSNYALIAKEKPSTVIKQEFIINTGVDKAWAVLGPGFAHVKTWASAVTESSANDSLSLNSSPCIVRNCTATGIGKVKEKLIEYSPITFIISYQVVEGLPKPIKYVVSSWSLTDLGNDKTKLVVTVELKTGGFIGKVFKGSLKRKMTKMYAETAEEFKFFVENGQPHHRKLKASGKSNI